MGDYQRREFPEALLDADSFEDLPGKSQAAIMKAEENRPNLRIVGDAWFEKLLPAPGSLCWERWWSARAPSSVRAAECLLTLWRVPPRWRGRRRGAGLLRGRRQRTRLDRGSDQVVLELTGNAWGVARTIEPHVARVVVVTPTDTGIRQARA